MNSEQILNIPSIIISLPRDILDQVINNLEEKFWGYVNGDISEFYIEEGYHFANGIYIHVDITYSCILDYVYGGMEEPNFTVISCQSCISSSAVFCAGDEIGTLDPKQEREIEKYFEQITSNS